MPNIQYDTATEPSKKTHFSLHLPSIKLGGFLKVLGVIIIAILLQLAAAVVAGFISAFSANIDVNSVSIMFDPQITIAYILVYYSISHFYKLSNTQSYLYFLFTLVLSFTTNFIQGAITLVALPPLLKLLHLMSESKT